jgi:hypothetical protein
MKSRTAPSSAYGASINQPQFFNQPILLRFYPNLISNRAKLPVACQHGSSGAGHV